MTNARQGWNAAQRAQEKVQHKPKVHGPVGIEQRPMWDDTCLACGYHNCPPTCIGPEQYARNQVKIRTFAEQPAGMSPARLAELRPEISVEEAQRLHEDWKSNFAPTRCAPKWKVEYKPLGAAAGPSYTAPKLNYDQAVQACVAGKIVRCLATCMRNCCFRIGAHSYDRVNWRSSVFGTTNMPKTSKLTDFAYEIVS